MPIETRDIALVAGLGVLGYLVYQQMKKAPAPSQAAQQQQQQASTSGSGAAPPATPFTQPGGTGGKIMQYVTALGSLGGLGFFGGRVQERKLAASG